MRTAPSPRAFRRSIALFVATVLTLTTWSWVTAGPARAAEGPFPVPSSGSWQIEGAGFGHGIGMSQWGAQGAALDGLRPDQILGFYYPGTTFGNIGSPNLRVQLTEYQGTQIVFGRFGSETLTIKDFGDGKTMELPAASLYRVTIDSTWMHLEMRVGSAWQALPVNGFNDLGGPVELTGPSGFWVYTPDLSGAGRQYWGALRVVRTSTTNAQAVNILPFDAYLKFVVPRESPSWFHQNALQSQAVAARSYARAVSNPNGQWDICDTTQCQVYGGRAVAAPGGAVTWLESSSTSQAVDGTSGIVLTEPSGAVAFTQFSASNGGYSVAGSKPYLVAKADPYSGKAPNDPASRWTETLPASRLQAHCPGGSGLQSFEITGRDGRGPFGGRITGVKVNCALGSANVTGSTNLRFGMKHHMWRIVGATSGGGGGGSGLTATIGNLEGLAGSAGGIRVRGWASGPTGATARITVVYRTNEYRQILADRERPDVRNVYPALGSRHGFDFIAPAPAGTTLACVWAEAEGSKIQLGCANVSVPAGAPFGNVDEVTGVPADGSGGSGINVRGWAIDPNTGNPLEVHVYFATGAQVLVANQSRPDVGNAFPSAGPNHGFSARVAAPSGSSGELCAYAINEPRPQDNPLLGCRAYTVP